MGARPLLGGVSARLLSPGFVKEAEASSLVMHFTEMAHDKAVCALALFSFHVVISLGPLGRPC